MITVGGDIKTTSSLAGRWNLDESLYGIFETNDSASVSVQVSVR